MLRHLPPVVHEDLLIGAASMDDAAVYRLRDDLALVVSIDVFTAIVDDPYDFGAIAAANALSDIYAMAADPLLALSFAAFPRDTLPLDALIEIQRGGVEKLREAGVLLAGGHSIDDPEPKYGMAVIGTVHPDALIANAGARPHDVLVLTKPIGTGVISTAIKHEAAAAESIDAATASMLELNREAAAVAARHGAHAMTDVSGYGLLGHLREMMDASQTSALVLADLVPYLPGVWELIEQDYVPGGTERNLAALDGAIAWDHDFEQTQRLALADAQTSGGLLIAVAPESEAALRRDLEQAGALASAAIGRVLPARDSSIHVNITARDHRDDD